MYLRSCFLLGLTAVLSARTAQADDASGLKIEYIQPKMCKRPTKAGDDISVHYRGTLQSDGTQFDASYNRGVPFSFRLGKGEVIPGWDGGLLDMCVGEQRKLTIPPELAYGDRDLGIIPPGSTLVFETELMGIAGVPAETEEAPPEIEEEDVGDYLLPPPPPPPPEPVEDVGDYLVPPPPPLPSDSPFAASEDGPKGMISAQDGECKLLGPFALIVQAALGALALLSLVFKRWRERPRRPLKIWFFDVSKQIMGTFLLHIANLGMSMFSSGGFDVAGTSTSELSTKPTDDGRMPNPCSFYLLNLAIDTTIGIPVLVILLKVLHRLFSHTALANPPESIKSGHYGHPPRVTWWIKQSFIYFIGLFGMKLFVFFLFQILPWLPWVGDWALRWTEGNEALQIAFVMFIFPVAMNAIQYYIVDSFIKSTDSDDQGFQPVPTEDHDEEEGEEHAAPEEIVVQTDESKKKNAVNTTEDLAEVSPTPLAYESESESDTDQRTRPGSS